ncbi:MAG: VanW family protein [Thermoleophilia bacterium]|nr:VanW family protein [Thermoleophilia bacterium]
MTVDGKVTTTSVPRRVNYRRQRRRSLRFKILLGLGCLIALLVIAVLAEAGVSYGRVHSGVYVNGVDLGRMTENEAVAALASHVRRAQSSPIRLVAGEKSWEIMPADAGAKMDVAGAVARAMQVTRESNAFVNLYRRWKLYFTSVDLPLAGSVDEQKLDSVIARIAAELDVPPVNASLVIEGTEVKVVGGDKGQAVDRAALKAELEKILLSLHTTEVAIPLVTVEPDVSVEDHQLALDQAQTMVSAPVTLVHGDKSWVLRPEAIAAAVQFVSEVRDGVPTLVPRLSAAKLADFFVEVEPAVAKEPVNASFDCDQKKAWVVPGQPGEKLDPEATTQALMEAALKKTNRVAKVAVTEWEPDLTTEEAEAMGIKDLLASYETEPYYGSSNRQHNVRITTKYAENVILAPGEVYDFEKVVGPRTPERGYKTAPGIVGEGIMEDVFGGGICQVSTTLFNAALEAGLEILQRHNHSLYIDHYPPGRDATIAPPKNLRFRNDTAHYIWIRGWSDGVHTRFNIYGTYDGRKVKITFSGFTFGQARTEETVVDPSLRPGQTKVIRSGQSARSCSVTRIVTMPDGTILHNGPEVFRSYYPMFSRLIAVPPSTTTCTTLPSSSTTGTIPTSTTNGASTTTTAATTTTTAAASTTTY